MTLSGIICPLLTPFESDGRIARDLWVAHAKSVLDQGAHYLSPFGTTGEALSMTIAERIEAVDWLIAAGIPAAQLMPGTGMCALGDTTVLTAHAVQSGCGAAMVLPSFFYGNTGEAGQARYFTDLIEAVGDDRLRIILYNIPQNSGVPVPPSLVATLAGRFPQTVVAYKDSAGSWDNTAAVIAAAPMVAVFPGSETFLVQGLAACGAGCISATVNINAGGIRAVYDGVKALMAVRSGDHRWLNLRAPHLDAELAVGERLAGVM
jgi:4-hydroxy-tetrahydrodipicolinate synthase